MFAKLIGVKTSKIDKLIKLILSALLVCSKIGNFGTLTKFFLPIWFLLKNICKWPFILFRTFWISFEFDSSAPYSFETDEIGEGGGAVGGRFLQLVETPGETVDWLRTDLMRYPQTKRVIMIQIVEGKVLQ